VNNFFENGEKPIGLSITQLQQTLPLGRTTIYRLIKQGALKTVLICGRRIIPIAEVNRLLSAGFPSDRTSNIP
jgi:Helix-turn-helix domain